MQQDLVSFGFRLRLLRCVWASFQVESSVNYQSHEKFTFQISYIKEFNPKTQWISQSSCLHTHFKQGRRLYGSSAFGCLKKWKSRVRQHPCDFR